MTIEQEIEEKVREEVFAFAVGLVLEARYPEEVVIRAFIHQASEMTKRLTDGR